MHIMQRLLADDGCPWDRKQTHQSLRPYLLEEAYEVIDAIDHGTMNELEEELGDLLLQVVFHAELAKHADAFDIDGVIKVICEKLERRHPHVFGQVHVRDADEVVRNWDQIKAREKKPNASEPHEHRSVLQGVSRSLPALAAAQQLSDRAAKVGFDWPSSRHCWEKVQEELGELNEAMERATPPPLSTLSNETQHDYSQPNEAVTEELGDLLFAIVNLGRHLGVDSELALRQSCRKFEERFAKVERQVCNNFGGFNASKPIDLDTLEAYWQQAKKSEMSPKLR